VDRNKEEIRRRVLESMGGDLLVFPELAVSGYSLRSGVGRHAVALGERSPLRLPPGSPAVALGLPERGEDHLVYNTALLLHEDRILSRHRKVYLPTYGMFDEGRYFASGRMPPRVISLPSGWRVGLLICEDFWHPSLIYLLAIQRVEVVVVLAAAPGRGQPAGGGKAGGGDEKEEQAGLEASADSRPGPWSLFSSQVSWTLLARAAALQHGVFMVIANRAGVEEGVTFAGESLLVAPDGGIMARAPQAEPAVLEGTLEHGAIRRARSPFAHLRDEDPHFLRRALDKILEGS
jgi:predicted amidohydrolase